MNGARARAARGDAVEVRATPRCLDHVPSLGHPEIPSRQRTIVDALTGSPEGRWLVHSDTELPERDQMTGVLRWVHDADYIERVRRAADGAPSFVDSHDCPVSTGSFGAATAAAGLAMAAALDLVNERLWRAFLVLRPPSHQALRDRAQGFCFFNSVAVAAEVVVRAWNTPILIVDIDADHGIGTQTQFYDRPEVGYVSVHRWPTLTGSGAGDEVGTGSGRGTTRNVPLAAGADDEIFCGALEAAIEEVGARLRPAAVLVSAGFDAHVDDPLGGMAVSTAGFARMTTAIGQAADAWGSGRVLSLLEGGFSLPALAAATRIHVETLAGDVATIH